MTHTVQGFGNILCGNVYVRRVESDLATSTLTIKVTYADREEQRICYSGVLYSQIDHCAEGELLALAVELTPEEYRGAKHQASSLRLQRDCALMNLDSLTEMAQRGYKFFTHYIGQRDEYIVIAKACRVKMPGDVEMA